MKTQMMSHGHMVGDTHALVSELVEVLRDELAAHHRILQLELTKREAIIARDGEKLKSSAGEQAKELHRIDLLESRREKLAERILPGQSAINLSLIIQSDAVAAPEKKELSRYQMALKSALLELRKLSEVNTRMLSDSRDLFKSMIMSLAGKGADRQHAGTRPVLVDANC
ncbi:MAG TPA: flagellar protein FlgN [Turneriella sp.]|nr:flagellar protein FlgN [Turneriella sp.]